MLSVITRGELNKSTKHSRHGHPSTLAKYVCIVVR